MKESAQQNKKRNKSQELGGGQDEYINDDENRSFKSSQGSLEVLAEDLSDVEQRMGEIIEDHLEPLHPIESVFDEFSKQKLTQNRLNLILQQQLTAPVAT